MKILSVDSRSLPIEVVVTPRIVYQPRPAARFESHEDQGRLDFKVVLALKGPDGAVAAYRGSGSDGWVLQHGDKLSLAEARAHFPNLDAALEQNGWSYDE